MKRNVIYENEIDFRIPSGNEYEKDVATSIRRRQLYELKDMTLTSTTEYVIGGMKYQDLRVCRVYKQEKLLRKPKRAYSKNE